MATYMNDGSGHAASAYDIEDTTGRAAPTTGVLDAPSFACSPMDVAIGYASPVDVVAAPTPFTLTTGAAPAGSWRVCQRMIFFEASRRSPTTSDAARDMRSVRSKKSLRQKDKKNY